MVMCLFQDKPSPDKPRQYAKLAKGVIILASSIARFQLFTLEIYMDFSNR